MQVKPQEVSADKATIPGQRERSEAAYVAEFNRRFGAHKTPQDIASLRQGDHYGIGRGYTNGWWKGWQAAEAQQAPQWSHSKPAAPGAYWVRGFRVGEQNYRPALVEVARNEAGALVCNMNDSNTNDELREWSLVEDLAERFEWCGPLGVVVAPFMPRRANVPARIEGPSGESANLTDIKAAEAYNRALDDVARLNGAGKESELAQALALAIRSLDQLVPYLAKVPADVGLLNEALMAGRKALQGGAV